MSSLNVPGPSPYASFFRHRTLGRAPSPPTWACYEQIQYDDEYSDDSTSDGGSHDEHDDDDDNGDEDRDHDHSCSEDDEDYGHHPDSSSSSIQGHEPPHSSEESEKINDSSEAAKDVKGKGRAVDPEHEAGDSLPPPPRPRLRSKKPHPGRRTRTLRPILTIHKSQGFVWNQVSNSPPVCLPGTIKRSCLSSKDLFVPPYIKDRCKFRASPSHTIYLPPLIYPFRLLYANSPPVFRHRVDLAAELSRVRFVFRLVYHFLPRLRGRGRGNSSGRWLPEKHHPLNHDLYHLHSPILPVHLLSYASPTFLASSLLV